MDGGTGHILTPQLNTVFSYSCPKLHVLQVNDSYESPDELDLGVGKGKYLAPDADRSVRHQDKLHSVLVHSSTAYGGHYYAYVRPQVSALW